jgi:epoxyqueuosine reductase QueG
MKQWLRSIISDEIAGYTSRRTPHTTWKAPLIAVADAADPLFLKLREVVRETHELPGDLLPGARSVIAYFVPFSDDVTGSNRAGQIASRTWATAYVETNDLLGAIGLRLEADLAERDYRASHMPATHNFDEETLMSDWSHKHVAYIAGLGTFGRHHLLITPRGCSGRLGTLVTDAVIEPTPRPVHEACLDKHNGTCGACITKCVAGALSKNGNVFDRHACYDICLQNADRYANIGLADVCGKCAVGVPCSTMDPVAKLRTSP